MKNLREQGKIIYIDTPIEIITKRLELMKTDRII
jgi:shikimate kinase